MRVCFVSGDPEVDREITISSADNEELSLHDGIELVVSCGGEWRGCNGGREEGRNVSFDPNVYKPGYVFVMLLIKS